MCVEELAVSLSHSSHVVASVHAAIFPYELSIAMLIAIMELSDITAIISGQNSLALELILLKLALIDTVSILECPFRLVAVLICPFEIVVTSPLLSLAMQVVILELSIKSYISSIVGSTAITPAKLNLPLVIVSIWVDKSSIAVR